MRKGIWYAIGAYAIWGLFPVYWKWLQEIDALQLLCHRVVWSFLMLYTAIVLARQWTEFASVARSPRVVGVYSVAAVLIAVNWLVYIWAVNAGYVIETSLGYFIAPLLNVLMGVIFLRERLRPWQWASVALATAGVLYLTFVYGALPWIALTIAFTFGVYGMVKKAAPLGSLHGLTLETGTLLLPALGYLIYCDQATRGAFLHAGALLDVLMIGAGLVTIAPLLLFASAVRRIPLSHMGLLLYIAPTLQFLLGVLVYREAFPYSRFVGYCLVWISLAVFAVDGLLGRRAHALTAETHRA